MNHVLLTKPAEIERRTVLQKSTMKKDHCATVTIIFVLSSSVIIISSSHSHHHHYHHHRSQGKYIYTLPKKSIYSTSSGPRYFKVLFSYIIRSAAFAFIGNIQYCVICKIRLFSSSSPNYNPS